MLRERVNVDFSATGSRFLLFPQPPFLEGFEEPEVVYVSPPPGSIEAGPGDDRMYVANALDKTRPYEYPYLPPHRGAEYPPARPGPDGHFDHLQPGTPQFLAAHMYGTLRLVLDIWERYFQRTIQWHFRDDYPRLELVPWVDWNNAQSGWGYIEAGYRRGDADDHFPMALNFDVLAHELGHSILYAELGLPAAGSAGVPAAGSAGAEFYAFHESASDLVAIVSSLHFGSVVDTLLEETSGNLFTRNFLNRIGESSRTRQIRLASNTYRMRDVPDVRTPIEALTQPQRHHMGEPLTGAVFDVLVEIFQQNLLEAGLIDADLDHASRRGIGEVAHLGDLQRRFDARFDDNPAGFKQALVDARDYMGLLLAHAWDQLDHGLDFIAVGKALLRADATLSGGHFHPEILQALVWREIGA
jgi:hypothetical protein